MIRCIAAALLASAVPGLAQAPAPIIDMHMHAFRADAQGSPPVYICAPFSNLPAWDPALPPRRNFAQSMKACSNPLVSPMTDEAVRDQSIAAMRKYNIYGMLGGTPELVSKWQAAAPGRFFPALSLNLRTATASPEDVRSLAASKRIVALFEVAPQYFGISPQSPELEPIFDIAEQLDLPIGIHIGSGPPGIAYLGGGMRAALSDPMLLEPVLLGHPRLRLWIAHGAYNQPERLKTLMHAHPQVYADMGAVSFAMPEKAFHGWICDLVEYGFGNRLMFGSDQMVWPQTIEIAVERVKRTPCLTPQQKRDIFYNNAARFLRLEQATIARHHASARR